MENHMENPNAFSNYEKTTLNHGLSLSEVDLGHFKKETTEHVSSITDIDWGGNIDPKYTSNGCMLMQVDWGEKLRVNHINECMLSEVDQKAYETHQNGHSITKVHWGDHDPSLHPMDGCIISEVDRAAHHLSSSIALFTLNMIRPKDFSTQGLWVLGRTTTKDTFHPSHGVPERFF